MNYFYTSDNSDVLLERKNMIVLVTLLGGLEEDRREKENDSNDMEIHCICI
jgi:hypothetical protein